MAEVVRVVVDGPVALLRLNRPERRNALDSSLRTGILGAIRDTHRSGARAAVITGDDRAFVAGADVRELATMGPGDERLAAARAFWQELAASPIPLIAAVRGVAFGGGFELALACDLTVAGAGARFAFPEIRLGLVPAGGGVFRSVAAAGRQRAARLMLTGEPIDAAEALGLGLISEVVADADVEARAIELAEILAAHSEAAVGELRAGLRAAGGTTEWTVYRDLRDAFERLLATPEAETALRRFLDRR